MPRIAIVERHRKFLVTACLALSAIGCTDTRGEKDPDRSYPLDPQLVYWDALESLCGKAFEGRLVESAAADEPFEDGRLVMDVGDCDVAEVRIHVSVGDDRSRTWVISTTAAGLRLTHDRRRADGTEGETSGYGGDTRDPGEATVQDFHAARRTGERSRAEASVWTVEIHLDSLFVYAHRREGSDGRLRLEFDLHEPVDAPPSSWGQGR